MHYPPHPVQSPVICYPLHSDVRLKDNPALAKEWKMSTTNLPSMVAQKPIYTDVQLKDNPLLAEQWNVPNTVVPKTSSIPVISSKADPPSNTVNPAVT